MSAQNINCDAGKFMDNVTYETKRRATTISASTHADNVQWALDKIKSQAAELEQMRKLTDVQGELLVLQRDEINALKADLVRVTLGASK